MKCDAVRGWSTFGQVSALTQCKLNELQKSNSISGVNEWNISTRETYLWWVEYKQTNKQTNFFFKFTIQMKMTTLRTNDGHEYISEWKLIVSNCVSFFVITRIEDTVSVLLPSKWLSRIVRFSVTQVNLIYHQKFSHTINLQHIR